MDLGFESLRDRQRTIMSIPKYRKFKKTDTEAVINLWKTCKLVVDWNDPLKDIKRKLSIKDNLFIIGEINKKIIATAMAGYDGHRGYIYYLAVLPELQKKRNWFFNFVFSRRKTLQTRLSKN